MTFLSLFFNPIKTHITFYELDGHQFWSILLPLYLNYFKE